MAIEAERLHVSVTSDGTRETADGLSDIESAATSARTAVGAMGAVMAAAGAAGLGAAASAATDFEERMVEVEKVTDPEMARTMSDAILEMANKIPLTTAELADLTAQAGRFGIRGEEAMSTFVEQSAMMAQATDMSAQDVGESFARLTTLMGMSAEDVNQLGAAINQVSNEAATSSQEITDSMLRSAGALSSAGMRSQDIIALSGALNAVSESSERAGTRLRRLSQEALTASGEKAKSLAMALDVAGENQREMADNYQEMARNAPLETIQRLAQAMRDGGMAAENVNAALSTTSRQALTALSSNLDGLNQALDTTQSQFENSTSLQREFAASMDTAKARAQLLLNRLRGIAIETGQRLLPVVKSAIQTITDAVAIFQEWNTQSDGLAGAIVGVSMVVGGLATAIVGLAPLISAMTPSLSVMAAGFAAVVGPVAAVAAALVAYEQDLYGVQGATNAVAGALRSEFIATWQTARNTVLPILSDLADAFLPASTNATAAITGIVSGLRSSLVPAIQSAGQTTRAVLQRIGSWWQAHGQTVIATVQSMRAGVVGAFRTLRGDVTAAARRMRAGLRSVWMTIPREGRVIATSAGDAFVDGLGTALDAVRAVVSGKLGAGLAEMRTALGQWEVAADRSMTFIAGTVRSGLGRLQSIVSRQLSRALVPFRDALTQAEVIVQRGMTAVHHAVRGNLSAAASAAGGALATLEQSVRSGFSRVISAVESAGDTIVWHAREAWAALPPSVVLALYDIYDAVVAHLGPIASEWQAHGQAILGAVRRGYRTARGLVATVMGVIDGTVRPALASITSAWEAHGSALVSELRTSYGLARSIVVRVASALGSAVGPVVSQLTRTWQSHSSSVSTAAGAMQTAIRGLRGTVNPALRAMDTAVASGLSRMSQFWSDHGADIVSTVRTSYRQARTVATRVVARVRDSVETALDMATQFWSDHGADIVAAVWTNYHRARTLIGSAVTRARDIVETALDMATQFWADHGAAIVTSVRTNYRRAKGIVTRVLGTVRSVVDRALGTATQTWETHGGDVKRAARDAYSKAKTAISDSLTAIRTRVVAPALAGMERLWANHGTAIRDRAKQTWQDIKDNAGLILGSGLRSVVATHFSALSQRIVPLHMALILQGITSNWGKVKRTTRTYLQETLAISRTLFGAIERQIINKTFNAQSQFAQSLAQMRTETSQSLATVRDITRRVMGVVLTNIRSHLQGISAIWQAHLSGPDGIVANARTAFNALWDRIIKPALDLIQAAWRRWGDDLVSILDGVLGTVLSLAQIQLDALLTAVNVGLDLISGDWEGAWTSIEDFSKRTMNTIDEWLRTDAAQMLGGAINIIVDAIKRPFEQLYDWLIGNSLFPDMIGDIASFIKGGATDTLQSAFGGLTGDILNKFESLSSGIETAIGDAIADAREAAQNAQSTFRDAGEDLGSALGNGINSAEDTVSNAAGRVTGSIRDFLPGSDAARGPLSDLTAAGEALPETLARGMVQNISVVADVSDSVASLAAPHAPAPSSATGGGSGPGTGPRIYIRTVEVNNSESGEEIVDEILNAADSRLR